MRYWRKGAAGDRRTAGFHLSSMYFQDALRCEPLSIVAWGRGKVPLEVPCSFGFGNGPRRQEL